MLAIIVANGFMGLICVLGGHPGAKWHVGFPMWMKQNWGIWGYLFPMVCFLFPAPASENRILSTHLGHSYISVICVDSD